MSPLDRWREILEVLWRRKLRTILTALSVAWGIFMLVVLLAAGNGLSAGVKSSFSREAVNSVWARPGAMSKPFAGNPVGRRVPLDAADKDLVPVAMPAASELSASVHGGDRVVKRGHRQGTFETRGCQPAHLVIEKPVMTRGRFINDADVRERRKVAVIGRKVAEALFARDEDPLGAFINMDTTAYQVVGTFEHPQEEDEEHSLLIPLTTAQLAFAAGSRVHGIAFTVDDQTTAQTDDGMMGLRRMFAARKAFSPDDKRAVRMWNNQETFEKVVGLFRGISAFVWLIGIGTILAGMVGVSNIMLISVTERTREIGVRKAVGAAPAAIVRMIVEEAVALTMVSGYLGLVAAVAVVTAVGMVMPTTEYFSRPEVDLGVGMAATAVLVVAGTLAGLFPALRAARINPIAALRVE